MKKLVHIALSAAMLTSTAAGAVALIPSSAAAMEQPWMIVTFLRGGKPVGNIQVFCNSPDIISGDTTNYDNIVYTTYFGCP